MERLTQELSLSDEQCREIEPVLLDAARRAQAAFQGSGGDRERMRQSMQKIARETNAKLEQILDSRQMKRYREIVQERRRQHRPPGRPAR